MEGSYAYPAAGRNTVAFECRSLADLMAENNFSQVDFLKMDIEGFEWEVLKSILKQGLKVSQICVEFHPTHNRYWSGLKRYLKLLELRLNLYCLVSHVGTGDHTFIKTGGK